MDADDEGPDFLDELVEQSTAHNPEFPQLMEQARHRRQLVAALHAERKRSKVSQTDIAKTMGTTQSAVSDLERYAADAKVSTVQRYAAAIGCKVEFRVVPAEQVTDRAPVVVASRLPA